MSPVLMLGAHKKSAAHLVWDGSVKRNHTDLAFNMIVT